MRFITALVCILFLLAFYSCDYKPKSQGEYSEVFVFADDEVRLASAPLMANLLEIPIDTPQPEQLFYLHWTDFENLNRIVNQRNIILMGTIDGGGEVSEYIRGMLDSKALEGVEQDDYWLFAKKNTWSREQMLIILTAQDQKTLAGKLIENGGDIYRTLRNSVMQRLHDQLYYTAERKEIAEEITNEYGFKLRIPHDFSITIDSPEERILRLRRCMPDRWLTIFWIDTDSLTEELLLNERIRAGKRFLDPVYIYPELNRFYPNDEIVPGGMILRGMWATESSIGGGPFFTYAAHDSLSERIYFIDGAVFAPDREKVPLLLQLEVMAQTFKLP
ncbi:DUF4837 family protein [bacterium]|nr:DUF4837 family protein [FCB group bacterium]MBL7190780.1 DUF4837 family protein [bacterium]